MELDSRTIAFLAVAAFLSLLLFCCIILSILFYVRYKNTELTKDDKEKKERERIKKLKQHLMKQFKDELRKHSNKRSKSAQVGPIGTSDDMETACSICLDSLAEGDAANTVLALLIQCGHVFHMDCVWPWLERDHSCPICRREMQLAACDLRAVTVHHVYLNFDLPSIRESVSVADLRSRIDYDCLEVVSMNGDDIPKTSRSRVIPVMAASSSDGAGESVINTNSNNQGQSQTGTSASTSATTAPTAVAQVEGEVVTAVPPTDVISFTVGEQQDSLA